MTCILDNVDDSAFTDTLKGSDYGASGVRVALGADLWLRRHGYLVYLRMGSSYGQDEPCIRLSPIRSLGESRPLPSLASSNSDPPSAHILATG